jgi:hypothetical protein
MRTGLSFGEGLIAVVVAAMLTAPQAFAQLSDYSTDTEEPNIMTVHNERCCNDARLKEESNVQINIDKALLVSVKPVKVEILNADNQPVAQFKTRDRVIYMHLPEGQYSIRVNGLREHTQLSVKAKDNVLKGYTI